MRIGVIIESRNDGQRRWEMPVQMMGSIRMLLDKDATLCIEDAVKKLPLSLQGAVRLKILPPTPGQDCVSHKGFMFIDEAEAA